MYIIFIRFGKQLLIFTVLVVFAFQGYWLWNTFQDKKQDLLSQVKVEMQQALYDKLMSDVSNNPEVKSVLGKREGNIKMEVFILESDRLKNTKYTKKINIPEVKMDSLLYYTIKQSKPILFKYGDIIIYHRIKKRVHSYPSGYSFNSENTTEEINALSRDKGDFSVHIKNLNVTTIYSMLGAVLFSAFYMILFLGTLFIIYRNLLLNHKLLKNKEVFTQNMTHELKIPVSTILIAAEGMEKYDITSDPESSRKYAHIIQRAASQLSSLVESILQNARADNNTNTLELNSVNLLLLLQDVQDSLSVIIAKSRAEMKYEGLREDINIMGNYEQLRQVFLNIIDNSLKYSEKRPVITTTVIRKNKRVIITIQDNGIGIPQKYEKEIFDPYFRIMNNDLHDVKGFGLGLSFVKSSLKKQNANIRLLNTEKEGTTIEINIPSYEL